ncbi:hypothetical protein B4U80_14032 [Leptotrombidium deliense]|uniref:Nuclear receptor coactivator CREB-bp-like interlocking domain-containing protein n=1 Tax=Leptotrombidium deliense TaxID=299467 RepID=A0A443S4F8_9ACAR|nr:hypothetical protein B4U80_14032 [Leptotrombidium deliense]
MEKELKDEACKSNQLPHTAVNEQDQSMQLAYQEFLQVLSDPPSEQQKQQVVHILQSNPRLIAISLYKSQKHFFMKWTEMKTLNVKTKLLLRKQIMTDVLLPIYSHYGEGIRQPRASLYKRDVPKSEDDIIELDLSDIIGIRGHIFGTTLMTSYRSLVTERFGTDMDGLGMLCNILCTNGGPVKQFYFHE